MRVVDLNQDGLQDLVYRFGSDDDDSPWSFRMNSGGTLSGQLLFKAPVDIGPLTAQQDIVSFTDYDLDGDLDLLFVTEDNVIKAWRRGNAPEQDPVLQTWQVKLFGFDDGFGFGQAKQTDITTFDYHSSVFADVNGDGFADYMTHKGADLRLYKRIHKPLKKIISVTDGYGLSSYINYRTLTDTQVYTRTEEEFTDFSGYGNGSRVMDLVAPLHVVYAYQKAETVNQYHYKYGKTQVGRGTLGFDSVPICI